MTLLEDSSTTTSIIF